MRFLAADSTPHTRTCLILLYFIDVKLLHQYLNSCQNKFGLFVQFTWQKRSVGNAFKEDIYFTRTIFGNPAAVPYQSTVIAFFDKWLLARAEWRPKLEFQYISAALTEKKAKSRCQMIKMINLVKYFLSATRKKKIVINCKSFNCEWYKLLFIHTVWSVNALQADSLHKRV